MSRFCQNEEPLNFFGGIIADPMGFGKTLTMISLVAMDKEREELSDVNMDETEAHKPDVTATLVIIPPPCKAWAFLCIIRYLAVETRYLHAVS